MQVGNDNTRWHWDTAVGSHEPLVPWVGLLFPDGSPVSYTEAFALRRYATGHDDFETFDDFLPSGVVDGDSYLTLTPRSAWVAPRKRATTGPRDVLAEASFWPAASNTSFRLSLRGYSVVVHQNLLALLGAQSETLATFDLRTLDNGGCLAGAWNILRVSIVGQTVAVWVNPMLPETGFVGDASDRFRIPRALPARITFQDPAPPAVTDGVVLTTDSEGTRVDYVSTLRATLAESMSRIAAPVPAGPPVRGAGS
jgi:hypothetical protein